jgi:hypothetical protein
MLNQSNLMAILGAKEQLATLTNKGAIRVEGVMTGIADHCQALSGNK